MTTKEAKKIEYRRPWLYPKQKAALFGTARYATCEASTKSGKTTACIIWLAEKAMLCKPGQNVWWIAPIRSQAEIAFKRLKQGLPKGLYSANQSNLTIKLANEVTIWFKGSDNADSLYGEDVYAAVIDEASRVRREAWFAVRSTLTATRGPIRMIGNVKGRRNWFFELCRRAEAGSPDMSYAKLIAADAVAAGVLSEAEVADAKDKLPESVFKELYLAEPSDDGGNPFGLKAIAAGCGPLSTAEPVCWGVDLAKSVDWTWAIGMDADDCVCRSERWQGPWNHTKERLAALIGFGHALLDSTGVGDPIVEDLQKVCPNIEGYKFTSGSKQQLMEGLASDLHQGRAKGIEELLRLELESYEYEYTRTGVRYTCPQGMTDDGVCALALCRQRARTLSVGILGAYGGEG